MFGPAAPATGRSIDINADLGEGYGAWSFGADAELLTLVSSANVACGFHGGDPSVIRRTLADASRLGVAVGAHVSYPDLQGFGRRPMDIPAAELTDIVLYQLAALTGIAAIEGVPVSYVKPHGALYNRVASDPAQAGAVLDAIHLFNPNLPILGLHGSVVLTAAAERGMTTRSEAFADRAYLSTGQLAPRAGAGAVLNDPQTVAARAVRMVREGRVASVEGRDIPVNPDSICVHGDSPAAVAMARRVRKELESAGIRVSVFLGEDGG